MASNHFLERKRMTGDQASVVFRATLWRYLYTVSCGNVLAWKRICSPKRQATHSSNDPPYRGAEKATVAGSPLMPENP